MKRSNDNARLENEFCGRPGHEKLNLEKIQYLDYQI